MGDFTELVIEGALCQCCGVFLTDDPPGHPQLCEACEAEIGD